jgi:hypothetical protein
MGVVGQAEVYKRQHFLVLNVQCLRRVSSKNRYRINILPKIYINWGKVFGLTSECHQTLSPGLVAGEATRQSSNLRCGCEDRLNSWLCWRNVPENHSWSGSNVHLLAFMMSPDSGGLKNGRSITYATAIWT